MLPRLLLVRHVREMLQGMRALQQGANDWSAHHYVFPNPGTLTQLVRLRLALPWTGTATSLVDDTRALQRVTGCLHSAPHRRAAAPHLVACS